MLCSEFFEVVESRQIESMNAEVHLLSHKKTGAHVTIVDTDTQTKTFLLAFRTPAYGDTGVTHIIEHSVLNGSRKYPDKDSFGKVRSGSLATMMSAGTAQDKTMYYFETVNEKDFRNLLSYFIESVKAPVVMEDDHSFRQEGWHYETDGDELKVNGVVFNEMKGVYSSSDYMAGKVLKKALYPQSLPGLEAGGDPNSIPELTYDRFRAYFEKYYHPSNCYLFLQGKMDYEEVLTQIHEEYLKDYDRKEDDWDYPVEPEWDSPAVFEGFYPANEEGNNRDYLMAASASGHSLDPDYYFGLPILADVLASSEDAPLKKACVKAGISGSVYAQADIWAKEPHLAIIAPGSDASELSAFRTLVETVLRECVDHGLDHTKLQQMIEKKRFSFLKADYEYVTAGIQTGVNTMDSWMFDPKDPFLYMDQDAALSRLLGKVDEGFFEEMLDEQWFTHCHKVYGVVKADTTCAKRYENELKELMKQRKAALGAEGFSKAAEAEKELKAWIATSGNGETPAVRLSDLSEQTPVSEVICEKRKGYELISHSNNPINMGRMTLIYSFSEKDLPYMYTAEIVSRFVASEGAGKIPHAPEVKGYTVKNRYKIEIFFYPEDIETVLEETSKFLDALSMISREQVRSFREETLLQKSRVLSSKGDSLAALHVSASMIPAYRFEDAAQGLPMYAALQNEGEETLYDDTVKLIGKLAGERPEYVEYIGTAALKERVAVFFETIDRKTKDTEEDGKTNGKAEGRADDKKDDAAACGEETKAVQNEGFSAAMNVNFNAMGVKVEDPSCEELAKLEFTHYLMNERFTEKQIREIGGAYHTHRNTLREGVFLIGSFRDSRVDGSFRDMLEAPERVAEMEISETEFEKLLVGYLGRHDGEVPRFVKADRELDDYLDGWTVSKEQAFRSAVYHMKVSELRENLGKLREAGRTAVFCSLGKKELQDVSEYIEKTTEL